MVNIALHYIAFHNRLIFQYPFFFLSDNVKTLAQIWNNILNGWEIANFQFQMRNLKWFAIRETFIIANIQTIKWEEVELFSKRMFTPVTEVNSRSPGFRVWTFTNIINVEADWSCWHSWQYVDITAIIQLFEEAPQIGGRTCV